MEEFEPTSEIQVSEAELLRLALAGDENAFRSLYDRLKTSIFRYAFYMTSSSTTAEEVTQEVFITLLKHGKRYNASEGDLGAFTFGIARNIVRRIVRRERPYRALLSDDALERQEVDWALLAEAAANMTGNLIRDELVASLRAAIASLPEHYRQAVVLCDLCELSYAEAAARLECAVGTVRSRLSRGHALLAQKLKLLGSPEIALRKSVRNPGTEGCLT
jgi:RNA polymerase sigma-70 factor (ECF subfamily)